MAYLICLRLHSPIAVDDKKLDWSCCRISFLSKFLGAQVSSAISSITFLHCGELRPASCCQGKSPQLYPPGGVRCDQRLVRFPKQCQVALTPHTRHAWLLVPIITVLAPESPFLRRPDKGAFLWRLFGISVVVGAARGNETSSCLICLIGAKGKMES